MTIWLASGASDTIYCLRSLSLREKQFYATSGLRLVLQEELPDLGTRDLR